VKEPNKFHNYETQKITRKASDAAEYIVRLGVRQGHRKCHHSIEHIWLPIDVL